jgi:hypothetical protein
VFIGRSVAHDYDFVKSFSSCNDLNDNSLVPWCRLGGPWEGLVSWGAGVAGVGRGCPGEAPGGPGGCCGPGVCYGFKRKHPVVSRGDPEMNTEASALLQAISSLLPFYGDGGAPVLKRALAELLNAGEVPRRPDIPVCPAVKPSSPQIVAITETLEGGERVRAKERQRQSQGQGIKGPKNLRTLTGNALDRVGKVVGKHRTTIVKAQKVVAAAKRKSGLLVGETRVDPSWPRLRDEIIFEMRARGTTKAELARIGDTATASVSRYFNGSVPPGGVMAKWRDWLGESSRPEPEAPIGGNGHTSKPFRIGDAHV